MNKKKLYYYKMSYDKGFHVDEDLGNNEVLRHFCSLGHNCKGRGGHAGWCRKRVYSKSADWDSKKNPIEQAPKALLVLFLNSKDKL